MNCKRLQLSLAESCPTEPLKGPGNSFPCQETLLYCKPASGKKDQYQEAIGELLAPHLNPQGFLPLVIVVFSHQAVRAGLMDYTLNYQQASPTDGLLLTLKQNLAVSL